MSSEKADKIWLQMLQKANEDILPLGKTIISKTENKRMTNKKLIKS